MHVNRHLCSSLVYLKGKMLYYLNGSCPDFQRPMNVCFLSQLGFCVLSKKCPKIMKSAAALNDVKLTWRKKDLGLGEVSVPDELLIFFLDIIMLSCSALRFKSGTPLYALWTVLHQCRSWLRCKNSTRKWKETSSWVFYVRVSQWMRPQYKVERNAGQT